MLTRVTMHLFSQNRAFRSKVLFCVIATGSFVIFLYQSYAHSGTIINLPTKISTKSSHENTNFIAASRNSGSTRNGQSVFGWSLMFKESIQRVQYAMQQSIYRYDRKINLPLMKLTNEERNKTFRNQSARKWLKSQRLVVASAVRNAMGGLPSSLSVLRELSSLFQSVVAVFVENDSTDKTRSFLYNLASQNSDKLRVFLLGCGTVNSPKPCHINISYGSSGRLHKPGHWEQAKRTEEEESVDRGLVMASLRNTYLDFIYQNIDADLLLVLEADLVWKPWDMSSVSQGLHYFKSKAPLDSLCAYTIGWSKLHDPCTLIFYHNKHFYVNIGETQSPFVDRIGGGNDLFKKHLNLPNSKQQDVPVEPVKVESCFQGAAFYRLARLKSASTFYRYSEGEWQCEHSTLSLQLRENYLDAQMVLDMAGQTAG